MLYNQPKLLKRETFMKRLGILLTSILIVTFLVTPAQGGQNGRDTEDVETKRVLNYWTDARVSSATPRDLYIDSVGNSFIGDKNGKYSAYGEGSRIKGTNQESAGPTLVGAQIQIPQATPVKLADTLAPVISNFSPVSGSSSSNSANSLSATVTDASGLRSVTLTLTDTRGSSKTYSPTSTRGSVYTWSFIDLTSGTWTWKVTATDNSSTRNQAVSANLTLIVSLPIVPPVVNNSTVKNAAWKTSSPVLAASGRLLFEMPTTNASTWGQFVCSATVVNDGSTSDGQTVLLTAAHCVYDDTYKVFARNVMFIPNQQASGTKTDAKCTNDIYGCWVMNFGVVDLDWTTRVFPNNVAWDYGYYVVANTGKHTAGTTAGVSDSLEIAVAPMSINFTPPTSTRSSAFGYSYSADPNLMHCAETKGFATGSSLLSSDNWWLSQCGLTGGASGGPWLDENTVAGSGQIISVNSWGYVGAPGMAGAKLDGSSKTLRARLPICIYRVAKMPMTANLAVNSCPVA